MRSLQPSYGCSPSPAPPKPRINPEDRGRIHLVAHGDKDIAEAIQETLAKRKQSVAFQALDRDRRGCSSEPVSSSCRVTCARVVSTAHKGGCLCLLVVLTLRKAGDDHALRCYKGCSVNAKAAFRVCVCVRAKKSLPWSRRHCVHSGIMLLLINRLVQVSFAACLKMSVSRDIRTRDGFAFPWSCVSDVDEMAFSRYSYLCSQDNMDWGRKYGRRALHRMCS